MQILLAGFSYFVLVFGAGFAFGVVRELILAPYFGRFVSVSIEAPFMLIVIYFAARFILSRANVQKTFVPLISIGLIGFIFTQIADFTVGLKIRKMTFYDQLNHLVTPAGVIYLGLLMVFLVMPLVVVKLDKA
jgi:hypothetical protein